MKQNPVTFPNLIQKFITDKAGALLTEKSGDEGTTWKLTVGKPIEYLVTVAASVWKA